jgi:hypothetical protein
LGIIAITVRCAAAGAAGREPDRVQRSPDHRTMQQHEIRRGDRDEHRQLRRDHASEITLAQKQEPRGKPSVIDGALGDAFGNATEQRKGAERHDERGQLEPRDQQRVQPAARASGEQRTQRRHRQR